MLRPLRVGVAGVGSMGRNHVRVYRNLANAELVGITDLDGDTLRQVASEYGVRAFGDLSELLEAVDAVTIAAPTNQHHRMALECILRGVHVLVEKPITTRTAEAQELIEAADAAKVILQVGHIERFNPVVTELSRVLANQRILAISAHRLSPPTPRITDVDVVFDLMIHDIDIALSLIGSSLDRIDAIGRPRGDRPLDYVIAHGESASGTIVFFEASKVTQETVRRLEVTTEDAYFLVNYLNRELTVFRSGSVRSTAGSGDSYVAEASVARPHILVAEPLRLELEHFVNCVLTRARPLVSAQEAFDALRVAERVQASVRGTNS